MLNRRVTAKMHRASLEALESRRLLATVTVNVTSTIRSIDTDLLGLNIAPWDSALGSASTANLITAMGTSAVRMGGGSDADNQHFNVYDESESVPEEAAFIAAHGNVGVLTLDYGLASPQEAAAELAYLNGSTTDNTTIGFGEQWNPTGGTNGTGAWVSVNWQTVSYWANLRASKQLQTDSNPPTNFMRLGGSVAGETGTINPITHPAAFGIHYWEVGNEEYGSDWETDEHGLAGDNLSMPTGLSPKAHDPATYVSFANQFATFAAKISPGISIGIDSGGPDTNSNDYTYYNNWLVNVLIQSNSSHQNFAIGFISDHNYDQDPGTENDATLLADPTTQNSASEPLDWVQRAAKYRSLINTNYGTTAGASIELMATEYNSVSYDPGKQSTSLVNGLFVADSLGELMQTEYNGAFFWDLHNGYDTTQNNSASLYGWRNGGDYGVLGAYGTAPSSSLNEPYPDYFAEELAAKVIQTGGTVISATSTDTNLDVFAVKESNGNINLMVVNKSSAGLNANTTGTPSSITGNFTISGFVPNAQAQSWQYGSAEDNAQKNSSNGAASLTNSTLNLTVSGSSFSLSFPSYSMTVISLTSAAPKAITMAFPYASAANQVQFTFDQDMLSSSFATSDLVLTNVNGGAVPTVQSVSYSSATKTATFFVISAGFANDNYTAALSLGSVSSSYGTPTSSAYSFNFFSLLGDANHDRTVNAIDFNTLATNYGKAGNFTQGDFDYSGTVGSNDFAILASQYGKSITAPSGSMVAESLSSNPPPSLFADTSIRQNLLLSDDSSVL